MSDLENATGDVDWGLRFLGVGNANSEELGAASAVLERHGSPLLLLDCGQGTPVRYNETYGRWPHNIFITHAHLNHVGGLEHLYSQLVRERAPPARLYAAAEIIPLLHQRVATLSCSLAEKSSNFWDVFHLIPVSGGFWHQSLWFDVFEARHYAPRFAFGLRLAGRFLYTGDTRPIPEVLRRYGNTGERLFHDCSLDGNLSHTGWADVEREYEPMLRRRLVLYHYESADAGRQMRERGGRVAYAGEYFSFRAESSGGGPDLEFEPDLRLAS